MAMGSLARVVCCSLLPLIIATPACSPDSPANHPQLRDRCLVDEDCNADRHCEQGYCVAGAPALPRFSLEPALGSSTDFGHVLVGESSDQTFVLSNSGTVAASIAVMFSALPDSGFSVRSGQPEDCGMDMVTLTTGESCQIRVDFAPPASGLSSASLGITGESPGVPSPLMLSGVGLREAALMGTTMRSFGNVEVGTSSEEWTWTISNQGDVDAPAPVISNTEPLELLILQNSCTPSIPQHGSCSLTVAFRASSAGARAATLTLTAAPGGTVTLTATANGQYRVTVSRMGAGSGIVLSNPAGLICGDVCSFLGDPGAVTLQARTANGSNSFFSGWSGAGCSGPFRDCVINVTGPTSVVATFSPMTNNLIFVTSEVFPTDAGTVSSYDAACNRAATEAGINDGTVSIYIAHLSDLTSPAKSRLAGIRGWTRMDGMPFADEPGSLFANHVLFNSVRYDEHGHDAGNALVMTGTTNDGSVASNCANWTDTAQILVTGSSEGGPFGWTAGSYASPCNSSYHLLCMGKSKIAAAVPVPATGRKIWMTSSTHTISSLRMPDETCQLDRPSGVTTASALIAYTNKPAAAVLDINAIYVRPDGTVVGTGAEIAGGGQLRSGIWQSADLIYRQVGFEGAPMWTGQTDLISVGTIASTCGNWADISQTAGVRGSNRGADPQWWFRGTAACDNSLLGMGGLYCVQMLP